MNTYYEETLYPLQNKVLNLIENQKTDFYLSGGTALSRCYFNHRNSDDLDLFVNQNKRYQEFSENILEALWSEFSLEITTKSESFYSFLVDDTLKVDLINDVAKKLDTFPLRLLDDIRWIETPPKSEEFEKDLKRIIDEMLSG